MAESFQVRSGRLEDVLISIGLQARITIILADPGLASQPSPGIRGTFPVREALRRALHGTDARPLFYGGDSVRIVRQPAPARAAVTARPLPVASPAAAEAVPIIVTASKQRVPADRYPGSVKFVDLSQQGVGSANTGNTALITKLLPTIGATNLGAGRNKFFIRGIADSSFSGPTQATTGQYLGDIRLNYNAPDPDLNLYDMQRLEVLVGPQGTLYGAGSLGGIIRLVPNRPDFQGIGATATTSIGSTRHGAISFDGAAMLNLPLAQDNVAARLVVYCGRAGGYIDAPRQDRYDINSTTRTGQRFTLRAQDITGWEMELGLVHQKIRSDDGQYTLRGDPPLTRNAPIAQPFQNNYALGYVTASRRIGSAELFSATSIAHHDLDSTFDATGLDGTSAPVRAGERYGIALFAHETRLSGGSSRAPWVGGIAFLVNSSRNALSLTPFTSATLQGEVANRQAEAAVFAKYSHALTPTLTGTVGERITFGRNRQQFSIGRAQVLDHGSPTVFRSSGTLALDWHPGGQASLFLQYQQGYRPGGLGITLSGTSLAGRKFAADDLRLYELGIRLGQRRQDRLSMQAAIFIADWNNIQADLILDPGLPYTTNIGRGIIRGLDVDITWRPVSDLTFSLSAFLNYSNLSQPAEELMIADEAENNGLTRTLPNIPRDGARIAGAWRKSLSDRAMLETHASLRYVGPSHLGFGPLLDVGQGDYLVGDATASIDFGRFGISAAISNIGDVRGNTFAYGNPYGLVHRNQITPLRPRTLSLALSVKF